MELHEYTHVNSKYNNVISVNEFETVVYKMLNILV